MHRELIAQGFIDFSENATRGLFATSISVSVVESELTHTTTLDSYHKDRRGSLYRIRLIAGVHSFWIYFQVTPSDWLHVLYITPYFDVEHTKDSDTVNSPENDAMSTNKIPCGKCFYCNSDLIDITASNYDYRKDGTLYTVKKIPARLCNGCGEKFFTYKTLKELEALISSIEPADFAHEKAIVIHFTQESSENERLGTV